MWKKAAMIVLSGALAATTALTGCGEKFTCENVSKKNEKCMDELVKVMVKGSDEMPEEMKKKMVEGLKSGLAGEGFIKMCKESMKDDSEKKSMDKVKECFKKSDCKEYAECIKKSMDKS